MNLLTQVREHKTKFITITGGVCSSLGKGVLISSIGTLLKNAGYSISVVKWDPYLNVDPGTMSPLVHGEVFVTADGAETDLDLGHYERMIEVNLTRSSSVSSGQIFKEILDKERHGAFLGRDIQLVPHVVDAIKERLLTFACAQRTDFVLIEIGGTAGDMEGDVFLETIRQLRMDLPGQIFHGHLSYVPYLPWAHEVKTKPTQHSVIMLKKAGLIPDALFLRTEQPIVQAHQEKLAVMCGIASSLIFTVRTHNPVYKLFIDLQQQELHTKIQCWFNLPTRETNLEKWQQLVANIERKKESLRVGLIAKYVGSNDPYMSVVEAIKAAGYACNKDIELVTIDASSLAGYEQLYALDGIVVPGGFDKRAAEGKILAAQFARKRGIPYLGLCLGMQIMLIEFARSVLGLPDASSTEFEPTTNHPVISLLDAQQDVTTKGATMRLGAYPCSLKEGTRAHAAYANDVVIERHRHRYEFNNKYRSLFEGAGIVFSGIYQEKNLVEIAELANHPFMLGAQFHPEFCSRPLQPHPLFKAFIEAIIQMQIRPAYEVQKNFASQATQL